MRKYCCFSICLVLITVGAADAGQNAVTTKTNESPPEVAASLKWFNGLVGSWRGIGQEKRGSRKGAWSEKLTCEWNFDDQPAILLRAQKGKQFDALRLQWNARTAQLQMTQHTADGVRRYQQQAETDNKSDDDSIILISQHEAEPHIFRCTIRRLSDIRATILFERKTSPSGSYRRIAGIGYTRAGAKLAQTGTNRRTCVVTGGVGTLSVQYDGKTYYVCCRGCLQAFNAAPDEIIAEYRASLKTTSE